MACSKTVSFNELTFRKLDEYSKAKGTTKAAVLNEALLHYFEDVLDTKLVSNNPHLRWLLLSTDSVTYEYTKPVTEDELKEEV